MRIGVAKEIKPDEYRVALTPAGVRELVDAGHAVLVQRGAGVGSAITDEAYAAQGATILPDATEVFGDLSHRVGRAKEIHHFARRRRARQRRGREPTNIARRDHRNCGGRSLDLSALR